MPGSVKKGLRHHCRKCGGVVCTSCYSCKEKLKVYVDRDDSVKIWVDPSKTHSPPAFTVCKRCHTQVMEELRVTKALSQKRPNVFCQLCGMPCMKKTIANELHFNTDFVVVPETLFGKYVDLVAVSFTTAPSLTLFSLYCQAIQQFMVIKMILER